MATRLRKTRKLRGGRHMGWGQVAQHRSFGHKGGLGPVSYTHLTLPTTPYV